MSLLTGIGPPSGTERRVQTLWMRILDFCGRWPWLLFAATLVWLPATIVLATTKRLWFDELVTLYMSRLPGEAALSDALHRGVDLQPPMFFWVTRIFESLFGYRELGTRAQAICFFAVFTLCLFQVARRRMGAWYGGMAVWLALCSPAFPYSHEARPYAMLAAFATLALLCWIRYGERPNTRMFIALTASIAATVSSHYYGIFAILPLVAGEAFRWYQTRRFLIRAFLPIAVGVSPLLFLVGFVRAGVAAHGSRPWNFVTLYSAGDIYGSLLSPFGVPLVVSLVVLFLVWHRVRGEALPASEGPVRAESVAAASYLFLPLPALGAAWLGSNMIHWRYLLPVVIGIVVICTECLYRAALGSRAPAIVVSACCAVWFVYGNVGYYRAALRHLPPPGQLSMPGNISKTDLPIFINGAHDYVSYFHYASPSLKRRLFFAVDSESAARRMGPNEVALNMINAASFFPFQVIDFNRLRQQYSDFLVYDGPGGLIGGWLLGELVDDGARIEVYAKSKDSFVYRIHLP